jgi:hypothetical protein
MDSLYRAILSFRRWKAPLKGRLNQWKYVVNISIRETQELKFHEEENLSAVRSVQSNEYFYGLTENAVHSECILTKQNSYLRLFKIIHIQFSKTSHQCWK